LYEEEEEEASINCGKLWYDTYYCNGPEVLGTSIIVIYPITLILTARKNDTGLLLTVEARGGENIIARFDARGVLRD
jgi:hypothetical protein